MPRHRASGAHAHRQIAGWFKAAVVESQALQGAGDVTASDNTVVWR